MPKNKKSRWKLAWENWKESGEIITEATQKELMQLAEEKLDKGYKVTIKPIPNN